MKKFNKWFMPDGEEHLPQHMTTINREIHGRLSYQYHKYEIAKKYIKNFGRAIDVGGHIGLWSYFLAHDFSQVDAFEPMPEHIECFEKNMENMDNVILHKVALGEKPAMVDLETRTKGSSGDTQVVPNVVGKTKMSYLDFFKFESVDFIKVDCEGYELFVMRGAKDLIRAWRPCIVVEQKHDFASRYGLPNTAAVDYLKSLGAILREEVSGDFILSWD